MAKYLLIALVILSGIFGVYFKYSQAKLESLAEEVKTLEIANQRNQETIKTMEIVSKQNEERNRELQSNLDKAEVSLNSLRKTLQEHDLTRLATEKPGLIEPRMQGATDELFQKFFDFNTSDAP
jgi:uncharacterized protein HemX